MNKNMTIIAVFATIFPHSLMAATANEVRCEIEYRGGLVQKIIFYPVAGKTYAINGQARSRAASRGWVDGFNRFTPAQMQSLLKEGLSKCGK